MKYCYLLFSFIFILTSCQKDINYSPPNSITIDPIPQFSMSAAKFQLSTRFLKKEVNFTSDRPYLKSVRLFSYDNANRCTEIKLGTIDSSSNSPAFVLKQTITFNYDSTNLLPSSLSSVRTVFPNLVTTYYYQYNEQGQKIKDSVRIKNQSGEPADRVINYQYLHDKVIATPSFTNFSMENNLIDTLSMLSGGNIDKLVSRMIHSTGDDIITYNFTYDQFTSPYSKLNIANSLYFESSSLGLGYNIPLETHYMGVTSNNMTALITGNTIFRFKYIYTPDGYPLKKEMFEPGESTNVYQVTYFEY